jgi:hypothetical protein
MVEHLPSKCKALSSNPKQQKNGEEKKISLLAIDLYLGLLWLKRYVLILNLILQQ